MHDGQNLFNDRTSFLGVSWRCQDTVDRLVGQGDMEVFSFLFCFVLFSFFFFFWIFFLFFFCIFFLTFNLIIFFSSFFPKGNYHCWSL